ncbi:MAG: glycerol-3-phosphate 1-O-acyltransferase PlsY [Actinomycetales bacterium]|nr:glycerol-3-phosphate 1-O-acyltransferase PlsY [Actinomycetales bacterium]
MSILPALLAAVPTAIVDLAVGTLAAVAGYGIGSVNPAAIIARVRGTDLRAIGSGNPGATNAGRAFGWPVGVLVGVLDVLKGFLPVLAFELLGAPVAALVAGLAAVLGHVTSPWLRGRGGKGVATSLGAVLAVQPLWAVPVLVVFGVVLVVTRRVGLSSVSGALILVPAALLIHDRRAEVVFAVALAALVVVRHRRNLAEVAGPR